MSLCLVALLKHPARGANFTKFNLHAFSYSILRFLKLVMTDTVASVVATHKVVATSNNRNYPLRRILAFPHISCYTTELSHDVPSQPPLEYCIIVFWLILCKQMTFLEAGNHLKGPDGFLDLRSCVSACVTCCFKEIKTTQYNNTILHLASYQLQRASRVWISTRYQNMLTHMDQYYYTQC